MEKGQLFLFFSPFYSFLMIFYESPFSLDSVYIMTPYKYSLIKNQIRNCNNCKDYKHDSKFRKHKIQFESEKHSNGG